MKEILHDTPCSSLNLSVSPTSAMCFANFVATLASSGFSIESIPSNTSSAARLVNRSG